jgi:hypothetical protein
VLPLLAQDPTEALDVVLEEFAVTRRRTFRIDESLALEETDLGDRDVWELLSQEREDVTDGEVGAAAHSFPATR